MIEFIFVGHYKPIGDNIKWSEYKGPGDNDRLPVHNDEYWIKVDDIIYEKWEPQFLLSSWERQKIWLELSND